MSNEKILIVDDDIDIIELIEIYLLNEGYEVVKAENGKQALQIIEENSIQLVVLDIMMPEMDGLETCRKIRKKSNIPIIVLSARANDIDKIMGLSTGADDYIIKPFNPLELLARVKAQLRRYIYLNTQFSEQKNDDIIKIQELSINTRTRYVTKYDKEVRLTHTEYDILHLLACNSDRVFSTEEIFKSVWKEKYFDSNNTVMAHIWKIREKIEDDPKKPKIIKNVWGVGYKIEK